ncbi:hypothetical protein CONPUDRAFT_150572 [Coniophora puteana RWD-64-598 SS2]|uniref:Uncharacterized protein n=1 Tax=Coniophora puteana (strain RWD-64-598) TaxID=741705 RepID=A0A5M3N349_CONPW|nr:uncharacterized protein CONPUDRAFT_150572 [Coniophora puteana RWD-64-598 SS2]EIW85788.1 hypothetical protein CONPUDRAFT_150572 [Coniophora puteana RWD-64-598 SS2]
MARGGHPEGMQPYMNALQLAACAANEQLPYCPELPADIFTLCLTSPINIALRYFIMTYQLPDNITPNMVMQLPGDLKDRRTPLGELNWIFTAVTDTIARTTFPRDIFTRLYRSDLLIASLFCNFLLAERIMKNYHCTPHTHPALPSMNTHQLWAAWDLAVDICLRQLPDLLEKNTASIPPNPNPGQTQLRKGQQQAQEPVQMVAPEKQYQCLHPEPLLHGPAHRIRGVDIARRLGAHKARADVAARRRGRGRHYLAIAACALPLPDVNEEHDPVFSTSTPSLSTFASRAAALGGCRTPLGYAYTKARYGGATPSDSTLFFRRTATPPAPPAATQAQHGGARWRRLSRTCQLHLPYARTAWARATWRAMRPLRPSYPHDVLALVFSMRGLGWKFGKGVYIPHDTRVLSHGPFLLTTLQPLMKLTPAVGTPHDGIISVPSHPFPQRYLVSTPLHFASGFVYMRLQHG